MAVEIRRRLRAHWLAKLALAIGYNVVVTAAYFANQSASSVPTTMAPGALDAFVPFSERAIWVYVSLYAFVPLAPLLATEKEELRRWALALVAVAGVSQTIFLLAPTTVAPLAVGVSDPMFRFVLAIDGQRNACPSLHASLAVLSAVFWSRTSERFPRTRLLGAIGWAWALAICVAAVATRRHVAIDIAAGAALSAVVCAAVVALRRV